MKTQYVSLAALLVWLAVAGMAHAAIVSEDSFVTGATAYTAGTDLNGQNPSVTGFSGAWTANAIFDVDAAGLTHPGQIHATGGSVVSLPTTSGTQVTAARTPANPPTPICYLSFLARFDDNSTDTGTGNQGMWGANNLRCTGMLNNKLSFQGHLTTTLGYADSVTYLFVTRIEANVSGSNDRMLQYYFRADDPVSVPNTEPGPITPGEYRGSYDSTNANVISSGGAWNSGFGFYTRGAADWTSGNIIFDELRVGAAWSDVVSPIPEPAVLGLLLALPLLARRGR